MSGPICSHRWMVMLGAPYGTSLWQAHDTSGQNGNFKQKLYDLMRQLTVMKGANQLPQEIRPAEVLPLVEGAATIESGGLWPLLVPIL